MYIAVITAIAAAAAVPGTAVAALVLAEAAATGTLQLQRRASRASICAPAAAVRAVGFVVCTAACSTVAQLRALREQQPQCKKGVSDDVYTLSQVPMRWPYCVAMLECVLMLQLSWW